MPPHCQRLDDYVISMPFPPPAPLARARQKDFAFIANPLTSHQHCQSYINAHDGPSVGTASTHHNDQQPTSKMSTSTIHDKVQRWTPLPFVCYNTRWQYTGVHSLHLHTAVLTSQYCMAVSFDTFNAIARFPGQLWHPTRAQVGVPPGFVKPLPRAAHHNRIIRFIR